MMIFYFDYGLRPLVLIHSEFAIKIAIVNLDDRDPLLMDDNDNDDPPMKLYAHPL